MHSIRSRLVLLAPTLALAAVGLIREGQKWVGLG